MRFNVYVNGRRTSVSVNQNLWELFVLASGGCVAEAEAEVNDFFSGGLSWADTRPGRSFEAYMSGYVRSELLQARKR